MGYKIVYRTQKCPTKKVEIFSHKQNPTTKQGPFQTYTGGAPLSIYPTSKGAHWGKKQILDAILIANKIVDENLSPGKEGIGIQGGF